MCIHQGVRVCYIDVTLVLEKHKTTNQEHFIHLPLKKQHAKINSNGFALLQTLDSQTPLTCFFFITKKVSPCRRQKRPKFERKFGNYFSLALF